jgi:hypothetical protein
MIKLFAPDQRIGRAKVSILLIVCPEKGRTGVHGGFSLLPKRKNRGNRYPSVAVMKNVPHCLKFPPRPLSHPGI